MTDGVERISVLPRSKVCIAKLNIEHRSEGESDTGAFQGAWCKGQLGARDRQECVGI
jgi:hypothetical protein